MRKHTLFFGVAIILAIASCKKSDPVPAVFEENGHQWQGWRIKSPPAVFDATTYSIKLEDAANNNAAAKLNGIPLPNDGPKVIYAVEPFVQGTFMAMKNDIERRGWHVASLSYLIALAHEYGIYGTSADCWNMYCDVPVTIDMGGGDECAVASLSNNRYNPATGYQYAMGLRFTPCAATYTTVAFLCYR